MSLTKAESKLISNVELNWAKLDQPVSPFGAPQYEIQIASSDPAVAEEMKAAHLNVKEKDGKFVVSLKRKAVRADGSDNGKVRVVDSARAPIENAAEIGNGSIGNVIVRVYPYEAAGRKGIASQLEAVQVIKLEKYVAGGVDFQAVADAPEAPASAELF